MSCPQKIRRSNQGLSSVIHWAKFFQFALNTLIIVIMNVLMNRFFELFESIKLFPFVTLRF